MGECKLDHSVQDVKQKLKSQKEVMPPQLHKGCEAWLQTNPTQLQLNDVFHLLKKYDLASVEEQEQRNKALEEIVHG